MKLFSRTKITFATMLALLIQTVPVSHLGLMQGLQLANRSITIGTSETSAATTYQFQFDLTVAQMLGSIRFEVCQEDPLPGNPCTIPSGFDFSIAALVTQTGETGFIIDPASTANDLLLSRAPAMAPTGTVSYLFDPTINPDTDGSYYIRLYTYPTADGSGPSTENAGLAFAITSGLGVVAYVPPWLEFCVGRVIPSPSCSSVSGSFISFGTLSETATRSGTTQMAGGTNAEFGLSISVIGTTMTSGINFIPSLSSPTASNVGSSQFGMNLRNNATPNIGSDPTGLGTITPTANYNIPNLYTYNDGDAIASIGIPTDYSLLTVSHIVNIDSNQPPGVYSTTLTYVATATF